MDAARGMRLLSDDGVTQKGVTLKGVTPAGDKRRRVDGGEEQALEGGEKSACSFSRFKFQEGWEPVRTYKAKSKGKEKQPADDAMQID